MQVDRVAVIRGILRQCLVALSAIHTAGLCHGGFTEKSIIVDMYGLPLLCGINGDPWAPWSPVAERADCTQLGLVFERLLTGWPIPDDLFDVLNGLAGDKPLLELSQRLLSVDFDEYPRMQGLTATFSKGRSDAAPEERQCGIHLSNWSSMACTVDASDMSFPPSSDTPFLSETLDSTTFPSLTPLPREVLADDALVESVDEEGAMRGDVDIGSAHNDLESENEGVVDEPAPTQQCPLTLGGTAVEFMASLRSRLEHFRDAEPIEIDLDAEYPLSSLAAQLDVLLQSRTSLLSP